jgi:hypothetical protein
MHRDLGLASNWLKCDLCETILPTEKNVKCHMTKVHSRKKVTQNQNQNDSQNQDANEDQDANQNQDARKSLNQDAREENNTTVTETIRINQDEKCSLRSGGGSTSSPPLINNNLKPKLAPIAHPRRGKVVPIHAGVFTSDEYFETDSAVVLKVDYSKHRYFPEKGPYRCEICLEMFETNKLFFHHVRQEHLQVVDIVALEVMEHYLAIQN